MTTEEIIICCVSVVVFIVVTWVWIWWDNREGARMSASWRKRLENPDYAIIEKALNAEIPASIKEFYASELVFEEFRLTVDGQSFGIDYFLPIDAEAFGLSAGRGTEISLANDGFGNEYLYDVSKGGPVVYLYHETSERLAVASSIEEFFEVLKSQGPAEE